MRDITDIESRWLDPERLRVHREALHKAHQTIACLPTAGTVPVVEDTPDGPLPEEDDEAFGANAAAAKGALQAAGVRFGERLGCGTFGCAYEATMNGEALVVKLTGDAAEAAAAQGVLTAIAEGRLSWDRLKGLARLKCVYSFVLPNRKQVPIYAVLQEKLGALSKKDRRFIDLHRWLLVINHPDVERLAREALGPAGAENVRRIARSRAELESIGIFWGDVHSGNLLADSRGRWTIIDLGASNNDRGVDVPALAP